jgi:MFS family permease
MYYFSDTFGEFLVAEFIDAIGTTLATGAFDAWAVDGMREEGDERPVDRLFSRAMILGQASAIVGGFTAAQLAERDMSYPWLIGTAGFLLCAVAAALFMRERRPPKVSLAEWRTSAYRSIGSTMREGVTAVRAIPVMRGLCLLTMVTSFATIPAFQMWQPRLQSLSGEGPWLLGWVWVFLNLALISGSALIPRVVARWQRSRALAFAYVWRAATMGSAAIATTFNPALFGFLLQEIGWGFTEPVLQAWMNEHATSEQRATILSVRSMAFTLGGAAGLVCLGYLARETSIGTAWLVTASIYALVAPGYLVLGRVARRHQRPAVESPLRVVAL